MKSNIIMAALALFLSSVASFAQYQPFYYIDVDVQEPDEQFVIDRTFMGNNTFVAANVYDNGVPVTDLSNITFNLFYARSQYATQGVTIAASSVASNTVYFLGAGDVYFEPYDNYYVSIVGVDTAMLTRTYGTGTMIQDYDPLSYTPVTVVGKTPWNWGLVGPYTGIWPIYSLDTNTLQIQNTTTGLYLTVASGGTFSALTNIISTDGSVDVTDGSGANADLSITDYVASVVSDYTLTTDFSDFTGTVATTYATTGDVASTYLSTVTAASTYATTSGVAAAYATTGSLAIVSNMVDDLESGKLDLAETNRFYLASNPSNYTSAATVESKVRGGGYGAYTNDILAGLGSANLLGLESRKFGFVTINESAATLTNYLYARSYGGVDYLIWKGANSTGRTNLMVGDNIQAPFMTNALDSIYQRVGVGASATNAVSMINNTNGALTFVGVTNVGKTFYFNSFVQDQELDSYYQANNPSNFALMQLSGDLNANSNNIDKIDILSSISGYEIQLEDWSVDGNTNVFQGLNADKVDGRSVTDLITRVEWNGFGSVTDYASRVTFNMWTTQQGVVNSLVGTGVVFRESFSNTLNSTTTTNTPDWYTKSAIQDISMSQTGASAYAGIDTASHISFISYPTPHNPEVTATIQQNGGDTLFVMDNNLYWYDGAGYRSVLHGGNFSASSYRSVASETLFNTNLFAVFHGAPTGVTQAIDTKTKFSLRIPTNRPATNLYFGASNIGGVGTNWGRLPFDFIISTDTP